MRASQAGPHQAGIEHLHTCGLAALCRAGMPGSVSASAVVSVLSRSPLLQAALLFSEGFPGGTSGKKPACRCRRRKRCRFNPWVGKIPWRRASQPTPVSLPGESHGERSLVGYSRWGHTESLLKRLSTVV
ncbi:unnamed protein product [Rangifer tarandus platyrhynchus]|uniref:Uncharacterized protein n=2 Tax=Rangifer tarandus platyrhynchus TaxID=3082113 RepID=A0AC59ZY05_RANTA|nr:unnamed protein product [Rangifer tarandus platyrhynchus]